MRRQVNRDGNWLSPALVLLLTGDAKVSLPPAACGILPSRAPEPVGWRRFVADHGCAPVPAHLRNAPAHLTRQRGAQTEPTRARRLEANRRLTCVCSQFAVNAVLVVIIRGQTDNNADRARHMARHGDASRYTPEPGSVQHEVVPILCVGSGIDMSRQTLARMKLASNTPPATHKDRAAWMACKPLYP